MHWSTQHRVILPLCGLRWGDVLHEGPVIVTEKKVGFLFKALTVSSETQKEGERPPGPCVVHGFLLTNCFPGAMAGTRFHAPGSVLRKTGPDWRSATSQESVSVQRN